MDSSKNASAALRDTAYKAERISVAATTGQLAVIDEAVARLGWDRSTFMRHASIVMAENVNRAEVFGPDGVLAGLIPPVDTADSSATA